MKHTLRIRMLFLAGTLVLAMPAFAVFGVGDVVFDPTNYATALQRLIQLQQQYQQLVQTYQMIRQQYTQMVFMAKQVPVDMVARYRSAVTPWRNFSATDTYGKTAGWAASLNTGHGVAGAYAQAAEELLAYGAALRNIPADQVERIKKTYATVELADGTNLQAIETIGRLRANTASVENTIANLENDSLSSNPDMNTEIAVLNKINAAGLLTVRNSQDTNKLLVALAEGQIIAAKRQRDVEAQAIRAHARFLSDAKAVLDGQASGASAAMQAWRMP